MSITTETVAETSQTEAQEVKFRTFVPEEKIEGWVTIESGQKSNNPGGRQRMTHYMHGLVLPGLGKGRDRRTGAERIVPRNRFLLPDKMSYDWFKQLMETKRLPEELEGISIRMHVKSLLDENIAFVRPSAHSLDQAKLEWKTRVLKVRGASAGNIVVHDDHSLCYTFYTRAFQDGVAGTIVRILPKQFKALVVMRNGFFYELTGAERLQKHVGLAGTNGMILDRDIKIALRHRQLFDLDQIKAMMADPAGFQP